ncbi:MAG: VOC family protein [Rhodocyclaceae bacterium]
MSPSNAPTAVAPVPAGYHSVTPYLCVNDASRAIDFYTQAFDAHETQRMTGPNGKIGHAEVRIGSSPVMLADEYPDMGFLSPTTLGGPGLTLLLYVADVDAVFAKAIAAGAEALRPVHVEFYGDRTGTLRDPFGHVWHVSSRVEDVPPDELRSRAQKAMAGG